MSTSYRVVRPSGASFISIPGINQHGILDVNASFSAPIPLEIRSSDGDLWRLQQGTKFRLDNTAEGVAPIIDGEAFSIIINSWHKSDTRTCHTCRLHSSPPVMSLIKPIFGEEASEYWGLEGDFIIHEFDEQGHHFIITDVEPGQHITIKYKNDVPLRQRYSVEKRRLTNDEIDYLLSEYLDPRKWSY